MHAPQWVLVSSGPVHERGSGLALWWSVASHALKWILDIKRTGTPVRVPESSVTQIRRFPFPVLIPKHRAALWPGGTSVHHLGRAEVTDKYYPASTGLRFRQSIRGDRSHSRTEAQGSATQTRLGRRRGDDNQCAEGRGGSSSVSPKAHHEPYLTDASAQPLRWIRPPAGPGCDEAGILNSCIAVMQRCWPSRFWPGFC